MSVSYLKKAGKRPETGEGETEAIVKTILQDIESGREDKALEYARRLDNYEGDVLLTDEQIEAVRKSVPQAVKDDIAYAADNVAKFAEAQRDSMQGFEIELRPGLFTGQVLRPMQSVGCYVPGGRYAHIATAIMTIVTAKVAGVKSVTACSPPRPGQGINPHILYTMDYCGADRILAMGGVQGIAAMAYGLFDIPPVDILVGPGNRFVAEAKRILFGKIGIDVFAGPTEIAIIADRTADPALVAQDLVSQAEHGLDSPAWLITDDEVLANKVAELMPRVIDQLPEATANTARTSWADYGEIVLCDTRDEMV
ncbi:MAG: histidinol dehydrogenase, partial [Gammaproteobacteria bacterium]